MKGHSRESTAKKLSCSSSFHGDIFPNVSYHWLKGWKSILESKALLSMSTRLSCVPKHLLKPSVLALRGVVRQYKPLMPLLRKRNSYLPQNFFGSSLFSVGVTDIVTVPLVCLEAEISDRFFGVTPSCTSLGRGITGHTGCSWWGLLFRGFSLHEQRL